MIITEANEYSFTLDIASEREVVYNYYCKVMIKPYREEDTQSFYVISLPNKNL